MITWLPDSAFTRESLPALRDSRHVDGLERSPDLRLHGEGTSVCIDGRLFYACRCGWVNEFFHTAPAVCAVEEAETERGMALWCADKRVESARARGERDKAAMQQAMAGERR